MTATTSTFTAANARERPIHIAIIGGGLTGLSAAWELAKAGHRVSVIEADALTGGLAGGFAVGDAVLEKFYHHWFTNDVDVTALVRELGLGDRLVARQSRTGMYFSGSLFRLSKPQDVLAFTPLPLLDRFRLAFLILQARLVRDWRAIEGLTAREWLIHLCGRNVYRVVWEPLLRGKFGGVADEIGAVWLWNKLRLRGGSRDKSGNEVLLYLRGGFAVLAQALEADIIARGGSVQTGVRAHGVTVADGRATGVLTSTGTIDADAVLITTALPIAAEILESALGDAELMRLRRIRYLANVCLVLELDRSLSSLYWTNVNDPSFPFVGIIEHTNFEPPASYGGAHIVYLSRYLPATEQTYALTDEGYLDYALPHIQRMFPAFERSWIKRFHVWRADYAQPIVERNYGKLIPPEQTSLSNVSLSGMAQIYPEDRGTNYAVKAGRAIARRIAAEHARQTG